MKAALNLVTLAGAAAAAAALVPVPAAGQTAAERITRVTVYGNERCPRASSGGEIVICARRPDNERYRIPKEIRDREVSDNPENTSWAERAQSLEYVGRTGIQSCSTVGPGGFTGCWAELMRSARGERARNGTEPGR